MKKLLLSLAVVSLISLTACKDDKKATDNAAATDSVTATADSATATTADAAPAATTDVPKFADAEVQKYVDDYTTFIKEYTEAAKAKDAAKLTELSKSAQEWGTKSASIGQKLASNPDDMKKFSDYVQKLSQEMTQAMTAQ